MAGRASAEDRTPRPIAVAGGRADFDVPTPRPGSRTLVIVSSLARGTGPFEVRLTARTKAGGEARPMPIAVDPAGPAASARERPIAVGSTAAEGPSPRSRRFFLLVRDGDAASASNYLAIEGRLAAVGQRVRVYVDPDDAEGLDPAMVRDVVATFDDRVYPLAASRFGPAEDVDGDGRFTVLVSGWLARLAGGRYKVDGFVRGADFDPGLAEPFGNRCDMMYLSSALKPGPHLRTVIAHEYTHAITSNRLGLEEEGWLDEGLAHLVEDAHGFSRSNIDYRVSAFLSRPEAYRLVVEDYYAADLFRSHGNRGGAYLFLRWCLDRHGESALDRMIRSDLRGPSNVEAATGRSFASLFREWTVALYLSGLDPAEPARYRSIDPRGTTEGRVLAGPRSSEVRPDGPADAWSAAGTSAHFAVVEGSGRGAVRVEVVGPAEAELQVTAVPLPDGLGGLDFEVRPIPDSGGSASVRARVASRGGTPVRLDAIAWEPLVPTDADDGPRPDRIDGPGIVRRFGGPDLDADGRPRSGSIDLGGVRPGDGPIVFKAVGTDALGRKVAAWAEVEVPTGDGDEAAEFGADSSPR